MIEIGYRLATFYAFLLAVILLMFIANKDNQPHEGPFLSEEYISLLYNDRIRLIVFYGLILVIFLFALDISFYHIGYDSAKKNRSYLFFSGVLYYFVIPVTLLLLFDYILHRFLLPILKEYIFCIEFMKDNFDRQTLFHKESNDFIRLNTCRRSGLNENEIRSVFVFRISSQFCGDKRSFFYRIETEALPRIANYIWLIRLPQYKAKEYGYLISQLAIYVLFFLLTYRFYFDKLMNLKGKSFFILVFLIVWTLFVVYRLHSTNNTRFFADYWKKRWSNDFRNEILKSLTVIERKVDKDGLIIFEKEYTQRKLKEDSSYARENSKLEWAINFFTAIIAFMIMQYIT